jgi:hypothetical protein
MFWNFILNRIRAFLAYGIAFVLVFLIFFYLHKVWPEVYYGKYHEIWLFGIALIVFGGTYLIRKLRKLPGASVQKAIRRGIAKKSLSARQTVPLSSEDVKKLTRFRGLAVAAIGLFGLLLALLCFNFYWRDSDQTALYAAIGITLTFAILLPYYNNLLKRPLKDGSVKMVIQGVITNKFTKKLMEKVYRRKTDLPLKRYFIVIDDLQVKVSAPVFMHYNVGDGVEFHLLPSWNNKVLHHELLFTKEEFVNQQG